MCCGSISASSTLPFNKLYRILLEARSIVNIVTSISFSLLRVRLRILRMKIDKNL